MVGCLYDEMFLTLFCFLGKPNGGIVQHEFPTYPQGMIYACQDNAWMDACQCDPGPWGWSRSYSWGLYLTLPTC